MNMTDATKSSSPLETMTQPTLQSSKPFSISLTLNSKAFGSGGKITPINPKKRPYSSLADDIGPDDEGSSRHSELVSGFDQSVGGAIGPHLVNKEKAPLIIKAQKNRDWREESRRKRGKNLLPADIQAAAKGEVPDGRAVVEDLPAFGLIFVKKGEEEEDDDYDGDLKMQNAKDDVTTTALLQAQKRVKTEDEEALEALMGERKKSGLVIAGNDGTDGPYLGRPKGSGITEDDAFRTDVASRPDSASLEDYAAVPVSEFGAALLRGMGWKGEQKSTITANDSAKAKKMERRPALLGIGAKEVPGGVGNVELGAWGKGGNGKKKVDKTYNPVLLKNLKTGEMVTEDELKAKQETQAIEEEEWRRRRDRTLAIDEEKKLDRKHRDRDRDCKGDGLNGSSWHRSSWRDRSRSPGHRLHRPKDFDDHDECAQERQRRESNENWDDLSSSKSRSKHRKHYDDDRDLSRSSRNGDRGRAEYDSRRSRRREEVY